MSRMGRGALHGRLRLGLLAAGLALVVAGSMVAAVITADVLARGELLPYTSMTVERVRVFGIFELWVAREPFTRLDLLNGLILAAGSAVMLITAIRLWGDVSPPARVATFFALLAAGLGFLALDELFAVHETVGYNLDFLADLPGVHSPEDVVFASYAIPVIVFFALYRDLFRSSLWGVRLVALGVGLFVVAAALDLADAILDEQWVEPVGSTALVAGLSLIAAEQSSLRPQADARSQPRLSRRFRAG